VGWTWGIGMPVGVGRQVVAGIQGVPAAAWTVEHVVATAQGGGDVGADSREVLGAAQGTQAPGDLHPQLGILIVCSARLLSKGTNGSLVKRR
jgi:hypothetical protein